MVVSTRAAVHDGRKHRPPNQKHRIAIKMADAILMAMSFQVKFDPEEGALNGNPATICPQFQSARPCP